MAGTYIIGGLILVPAIPGLIEFSHIQEIVMKKILILTAPLLLTASLMSGCVGLALGTGATVGVAAAQEGGLEAAASDTLIVATINDLWFKYDIATFAKLNLTVNQGRVLITGVVQKPEARVEAVRLAWQARGVKEVINEIRVANSGGITGYARDTWITARLRTMLTFERGVQSINYSIDTVQGTVYLMGVAQGQAELNRAIQVARTIPDVKQVVSYVKLAGEPVISNTAPVQKTTGGGMLTSPQPDTYTPQDSIDWSDRQEPSRGGPVPLVPEPVTQEPIDGGGF